MKRHKSLWFIIVLLAAVVPALGCGADSKTDAAAQVAPVEGAIKMEKATFGAGCFWGVEDAFRKIDGVVATQVGYTGGKTDSPTYKDVCTDRTGHAEAVEVTYDPSKVSYEDLLKVFWSVHDPTQMNRQGPDTGSQYRSVIFYHNAEQEKLAKASKQALQASGKHGRQIVTEIVPAGKFHRAEEYHQQYLEKRGMGTCH
jgi:peptide-methionine (S)-S-oxide reductase